MYLALQMNCQFESIMGTPHNTADKIIEICFSGACMKNAATLIRALSTLLSYLILQNKSKLIWILALLCNVLLMRTFFSYFVESIERSDTTLRQPCISVSENKRKKKKWPPHNKIGVPIYYSGN